MSHPVCRPLWTVSTGCRRASLRIRHAQRRRLRSQVRADQGGGLRRHPEEWCGGARTGDSRRRDGLFAQHALPAAAYRRRAAASGSRAGRPSGARAAGLAWPAARRARHRAWQVRLGELLSYLPIDDERVAEARVRTSLSALYAERDAWLRDADADREGALEGVVDRLVTSCGVDGPGSGDATARVLALAHGVTVQVCRQRLEPVAVVRLMTAEVERLAYARSGRVG